MRRSSRFVVAAVLGSSALIALGVGGGSALGSPASVAQPVQRIVAYVPLRGHVQRYDTTFKNLEQSGGPIMPSNTNYTVYWSPSGTGAYPAEYISGVNTYFADIAHDSGLHTNVDAVEPQYRDGVGHIAAYNSHFGGQITDTDAYPASQCPHASPVIACLTDAQMQAEIAHVIATLHLTRDLTHEYFLLTPPHVESCNDSNPNDPNGPYGGCSAGQPNSIAVYCAYHNNSLALPFFIYADDPFVNGNQGCDDGNHPNGPSDSVIEGGVSHEHNESVTDPIPNSSWTDIGGNTGEIGDKCDSSMGTTLGTHNGAAFNQVINGHFYWYQEEWSNQGHKCVQSFTFTGTMPTARLTVTHGAGTSMTFNASASTGGIVRYNWQFNDGPGLNNSVESSSPSVSHTFPSATPFYVALTVYTSNGTSATAGGIVLPGHSGLQQEINMSPASATHGVAETFTAVPTSINGAAVTGYYWTFGDGSRGTGRTPSHTYTTAGSYQVELTIFLYFAGTNNAASVLRTITVS
jgi:hypothetical protein